MKGKILFNLLIVSISILLLQSCLKRFDPSCPGATSIAPDAARFGDTITITGSDFEKGLPRLYKVSIGDKEVPVLDVPAADKLRFIVPVGIGSGVVTLTLANRLNCANLNLNFVYKYTVKLSGIINPFAGVPNQISCPKCFSSPQGLEVDGNSNIIVADMNHHVIKKIDTSLREPVIFAGINDVYGHIDNSQLSSTFKSPSDVAISASGDIYVADRDNSCIRKISGGNVKVFSGSPSMTGSDNGPLLSARYIDPTRITTNGTDLFVTEPSMKRIRLITTSQVTTFVPNAQTGNILKKPFGISYSDKRAQVKNDAFKIFLADQNIGQAIEGFDPAGNLTTVSNSSISQPYDVALDDAGNLFVLDKGAQRIFVIYTDNSSQIIAENGTAGTIFNTPSAIAIDKKSKLLYVSDELAQTIIRIRFE